MTAETQNPSQEDTEFPCSIDIEIPFHTERLADVAHRTLSVDKELSSLVRRSFSLRNQPQEGSHAAATVLHVRYKATTNRMLRVAVNAFMESLYLVIEVMEHLDVDPGKKQAAKQA
ncbi:transcription factor Pcc1 [Sodiomyces alkalinus F11]|uniref:Transcription factor Pcc1 n=1 Tax=Sodiomyces alkalinus (strain CBS 110278 / VKM F-3762 / F11) TaxID=1314773 RepID=A0A3N2PZY8_SODAK|nr:transcription factor Pcc1 [Sodiomyces alkalinus F11]ROT40067.1 transcription factor Pcc1 [Sodiomyces alkalinus F11]